jgi:hypothetical protein
MLHVARHVDLYGNMRVEKIPKSLYSSPPGWEELLHWGPCKMCYESLRIRASLSIWALFIRGEPGMWWDSYTGDFYRRMKEGCSGGAYLCDGFREADLEVGLLYWGNRKMRFLRDIQNAL